MSRGKQALASANRLATHLEGEVARLREELRAAKAATATALRRSKGHDVLVEEVKRLKGQIVLGTSPALDREAKKSARLQGRVDLLLSTVASRDELFDALLKRYCAAVGHDRHIQGIEDAMSELTGEDRIINIHGPQDQG